MSQEQDKQNLIRAESAIKVGSKIEMDNKIYLVKSCRQLLEALGEPEGFCLELEEVLQ